MAGDSERNTPTRTRRGPPVPWRKDPVILARMVLVERGYFAKKTNTAMADELGVDEGTVRNDLKRLRELWMEQAKADQAAHRARVLAKLAETQRLALAAAAFDEAAERAVLYGQDAQGTPVLVERDAKGAAQFRGQKAAALNVYRQAVMDEARVLGVDMPDEVPMQPMQVVIVGVGVQDI